MSITFETVETFASYDEAFPPGWSPVTREQERALAEQLRRDFPPAHDGERARVVVLAADGAYHRGLRE